MCLLHQRNACLWLKWKVGWFLLVLLPSLSLHSLGQETGEVVPGESKMDDREITNAILTSLSFNDMISSESIQVQTQNGIVTLTGTANNLLSKELAVETAKTVRGVRSVVDRLAVQSAPRSDREIRSDVRYALRQDPATRSYPLSAEVANGVVTLKGDLRSWAEKELALEIAKGVKGVIGVRDATRIRPEAERKDAEIASEIKEHLESDIWAHPYRIQVEVNKGYVNLRGTTGSVAEKDSATADALSVAGVKGVYNGDLNVEPWARDPTQMEEKSPMRADSQIKRDIQEAFLRDPRVASFQTEVEVSSGIVTVDGSVDNLKAKWSAEQDARNTLGVVQVRNHLRVEPANRPPDFVLVGDIQQALLRDPVLSDNPMEVRVIDGVAYLNGTVDHRFEKTRAEDLVSRVTGIVDVRNELDIHPTSREETPRVVMNDSQLKRSVENQLSWSPLLEGRTGSSQGRGGIQVDVRNGVVTLSGEVASLREFEAAQEIAHRAGAKSVRNRLRIR